MYTEIPAQAAVDRGNEIKYRQPSFLSPKIYFEVLTMLLAKFLTLKPSRCTIHTHTHAVCNMSSAIHERKTNVGRHWQNPSAVMVLSLVPWRWHFRLCFCSRGYHQKRNEQRCARGRALRESLIHKLSCFRKYPTRGRGDQHWSIARCGRGVQNYQVTSAMHISWRVTWFLPQTSWNCTDDHGVSRKECDRPQRPLKKLWRASHTLPKILKGRCSL